MNKSEAERPSIRAGILRGPGAAARWQARCIELLISSDRVRWVVDLIPESSCVSVSAFVSGAAVAPARVILGLDASGRVAPLSDEAMTRLRDYELDFILCFMDGALPTNLLDIPRHGVWRYHWGDWQSYRGDSANFWEVYDRAPASAALLLREQADPECALVLREGCLRTQWMSMGKNLEQRRNRFTHWPAQLCREIGTGAIGPLRCSVRRATGPARRAPTRSERISLRLRLVARAAVALCASLFRHDQWNIGIIDRPIEDILTLKVAEHVRWLPPTPRAELRADPFGTVREGRSTIFCEYFSYRDNRGYIVAMEDASSAASTRVRIGPEPPVHLSYPYLIEVGGTLTCVPESSAAGEVAMYEFERFPDRCRRVATLIGRPLADATVFTHQDRWWLAGSDVAPKGANSELHLWFSDAPQGPWTAHPGNPVKVDVRSARPAGTPFVVDGVLYRPAQDCSTSYGARVVINRVLKLTPDEFLEEHAAALDPDPLGPYPKGLHTVSRLGNRTLIDGKRCTFVPAEFFRVLKHHLHQRLP